MLAERRWCSFDSFELWPGSLWQRQQHHHYSPAQSRAETPPPFLMCMRFSLSTFCLWRAHTTLIRGRKCIAAVIIMNAKCQHVAPNFVHYYGRAVNVSSKLTLYSRRVIKLLPLCCRVPSARHFVLDAICFTISLCSSS